MSSSSASDDSEELLFHERSASALTLYDVERPSFHFHIHVAVVVELGWVLRRPSQDQNAGKFIQHLAQTAHGGRGPAVHFNFTSIGQPQDVVPLA